MELQDLSVKTTASQGRYWNKETQEMVFSILLRKQSNTNSGKE